jgi:hypothetical protein
MKAPEGEGVLEDPPVLVVAPAAQAVFWAGPESDGVPELTRELWQGCDKEIGAKRYRVRVKASTAASRAKEQSLPRHPQSVGSMERSTLLAVGRGSWSSAIAGMWP